MYDKETIVHLFYLLTTDGNLFRNMSDACETANDSFTGITHISEKDLQMLLTLKEGHM